jgi:RNA polymerase sigma factor (sigma-70 family)
MCDHPVEQAPATDTKPSAEVVATLVANHRAFLNFVARRVGNRDVAEEILQNAFVKNVDKLDSVRETATGWFYKVLRNAIIDYTRHRNIATKSLATYATNVETDDTRDDELHGVVCSCVAELASTLKPEYADALRRIDVEGISVKAYAEQVGITANNAGVRVFRAREALRKQVARSCGTCADHGCLDCTCAMTPAGRRSCGHSHH